jgi:hypothetical protein
MIPTGISASPDGAFHAWVNDSLDVAYHPDLAGEIDKEEEILADLLGITPKQALSVMEWHEEESKKLSGEHRESFGRVIAFIIQSKNPRLAAYGLGIAGGLDQLDGLPSQAELARGLGVTRSLVSHYVTAAADLLGVTITKYRKSEASREIFSESRSWLRRAYAKREAQKNQS